MGKYSETLTEHVMAPRNGGAIENPDLTGHAGAPGRGAFMILYLKVQDERIAAAKYHTIGCGPTIASGSMLTGMIAGKSIAKFGKRTEWAVEKASVHRGHWHQVLVREDFEPRRSQRSLSEVG
jgi:nitrogen fixation protein NifU and related proteins